VVMAMHAYSGKVLSKETHLRHVARHMLGLYHGHRRARLWRRMLSDSSRLARNDPALLLEAMEAVESAKFPEMPDERRTEARVG
jgi:tRNA-dihydrouridine synthase A